MRKYNLEFLKNIKSFKYQPYGKEILKEYTLLFRDIYNHEISHHEGIAYAPHILRAVASLQWSSKEFTKSNEQSINFYLKLTDKQILKNFKGGTLTEIHHLTGIPIETLRRKIDLMIKKGWLMKKDKQILQTHQWLIYHVPMAIAETDRVIEAATKISKLLSHKK